MSSPSTRPAPAETPVPASPSSSRPAPVGPASPVGPSSPLPARAGGRLGWLAGAVWLFFLSKPVRTAWHNPDPIARYLGVAAMVAFGASFVLLFLWSGRARRERRAVPTGRAWQMLAGMLLLAALAIPGAGGESLATLVYIAATAVLLLPRRHALLTTLVLAATPPLAAFIVPSWRADADTSFAVILAVFTSFGVLRLAERNSELLAAQEEIHRLAVTGERARAARDLHDILGHSLTVVAIKAELAGRLLEVDPSRAAGEIAEVEQLARQALADVRSTVGAYREVTLAGELASARSALDAAGIRADLPTSIEAISPARSELFGWAIREGVTNVIRHSGAARCTVRVSGDRVEVLDDGQGPTCDSAGRSGAVGGHGLLGLRERTEQFDGRLTVGRDGPTGGFLLRVSLPREAR